MKIQMQNKIIAFLFLVFVLSSCEKENQKRLVENKKDREKRELIFTNIQKAWIFNDTPINTTSESIMGSWNEFRMFLEELARKPKKTIGAFQKKSAELSKKVTLMTTSVPYPFDKPQVKSRVAALATKVQLLDVFIHLDNIPDKKVIRLIAEINNELVSLQRQMNKVDEKSKIPVEEGEYEMLMMLDTTRAIPNSIYPPTSMPNNSTTITPANQNIPRVE